MKQERPWRYGVEEKPKQQFTGSLVPAALHQHSVSQYKAGKSYTIDELLEINGIKKKKSSIISQFLP